MKTFKQYITEITINKQYSFEEITSKYDVKKYKGKTTVYIVTSKKGFFNKPIMSFEFSYSPLEKLNKLYFNKPIIKNGVWLSINFFGGNVIEDKEKIEQKYGDDFLAPAAGNVELKPIFESPFEVMRVLFGLLINMLTEDGFYPINDSLDKNKSSTKCILGIKFEPTKEKEEINKVKATDSKRSKLYNLYIPIIEKLFNRKITEKESNSNNFIMWGFNKPIYKINKPLG